MLIAILIRKLDRQDLFGIYINKQRKVSWYPIHFSSMI